MRTTQHTRAFGTIALMAAALCLLATTAHASEPAPDPKVTLDKARAMAKAACATAEPLISPFADAVTRFSAAVKDATEDRIETLKAQLVELQSAAQAPTQATDAATTAYQSFSKLVNRRRTISHRDLALAARFKSVRYTMRKARKALAKAAEHLLKPPAPAAPTP